MGNNSKWSIYNEKIDQIYLDGHIPFSECARELLGESATQKDVDLLRTYIKRRVSSINKENVFDSELSDNNFSPATTNWSVGWLKTEGASILIKNKSGIVSFDDIRQEFIEEMNEHSPSFNKIERDKDEGEHLLVIDIADLHIGKLASKAETGEEYNVKEAIKRATEGVAGVLSKASGYAIEKVLFVVGNDVLHVDNANKSTTKGTPQDVDGMWFDNYIAARKLYVSIINSLVQEFDVHVVHNPSNHDFVTGFMLADSIACWFRNHPNITFDVTNAHRKYYRYGSNLIGTSHGDGAKMEHLPLIMANEAKADWAETDFRYIYLHHIHHKKQFLSMKGKDYHGVNIEYLRSPSSSDSWHHYRGYQHSMKAVEGFVHHKEFGQVARITHLFR